MCPIPKRAVPLAALAASVVFTAFAASPSEIAAGTQQIQYGLSCMYTEHLIGLGGPAEESAYTDPGDGYTESEWTVEFKHYNSVTERWTPWLSVETHGAVDELAHCTVESDNTRIWAFSSSYVRLDQITETQWRVFIKDEYPGNACDDDESAPVSPTVNAGGEGALWETACTSRAIGWPTSELVVPVEHEL